MTTFYDRYLQEVNAWTEVRTLSWTRKTSSKVMEKTKRLTNPRVRAIRARIQEKSEKKKFPTKLDRNRLTSLSDELANDLAKGKNNYPHGIVDAMQLAQTYQSDGCII